MAKPRSKLLDGTIGAITIALLGLIKRMDRKRTANFAAACMRTIGRLLPENRVGRENLRAAFPDKSETEIEKILAGVWDNLGRIAVEFAHLDEFCIEGAGQQTADMITYAPEAAEHYRQMLERGKPMLGFAAHLANWECLRSSPNCWCGIRRCFIDGRTSVRSATSSSICESH